jgi:pimeloyl-ACP methyl ester carboxylesterase
MALQSQDDSSLSTQQPVLSTDPASISKALHSPTPVTRGDDSELRPSCPPPLAWVDILHEFRQSSELVEAPLGNSKVTARVWGTGQPLYILPGICGNSEIFCLLGWLMRDDFRCVIIDYADDAATIESYADAMFAIADKLGDQEFDLFGTSFGSAIGILSALEKPARIKHLALQGPLGEFKLSFFEWLAAKVFRFLPGRLSRLPLRRRIHAATHRLWYPPVDESRWSFHADNSGLSRISQVARRALWLSRNQQLFAEITTPVLLISGEGEAPRYVEAAVKMEAEITGAKHEHLSNAGHVPFITHPHRLANLLRPFFSDEATA